MNVVGYQQEIVDLSGEFRLLAGERLQLVKGIERQKLNAGAAVNHLAAKSLNGAGHHAVGAFIAIGDGQTDALPLFVEQEKVYAPGINADAVDRDPRFIQTVQPGQNMLFQDRKS